MAGGIGSGFRHVKPDEYKPRLFEVRRTKKTVRAWEVPCTVKNMNRGDVFVLDAGIKVYCYVGPTANAFEKMKGGALQHNIVSSRMGKSKKVELDDDFWKTVGGAEKDVGPEIPETLNEEDEELDRTTCKLFRLSDASGKMKFTKEKDGHLTMGMLDTNDVFIVDAKIQVFVWVGSRSTKQEKSQSMKYAEQYLKTEGRPVTTPITQLKEGQTHFMFAAVFDSKEAEAAAKTATKGAAAAPAKGVVTSPPKGAAAPAAAAKGAPAKKP